MRLAVWPDEVGQGFSVEMRVERVEVADGVRP